MSQEQWIDLGLYASYILIVIAIVAAVVMNFVNALKNPKSLIKSGIGIGALAIVYLIGWSMAPAEVDRLSAAAFDAIKMDPTSESTQGVYRHVGGAMTTTLVLLIVAVVGLIYSSVARIVK